jgi:hypothetical protein
MAGPARHERAATAPVNAGVDLKTEQTPFGHSDVRLTIGRYAQAV